MKKVARKRIKDCPLKYFRKTNNIPIEIGFDKIVLTDILFERMSICCPERYDAYSNTSEKKYLAHIRLRYGQLFVYHPNNPTKLFYYKDFDDWSMNNFKSNEQRVKYLTEISKILNQ